MSGPPVAAVVSEANRALRDVLAVGDAPYATLDRVISCVRALPATVLIDRSLLCAAEHRLGVMRSEAAVRTLLRGVCTYSVLETAYNIAAQVIGFDRDLLRALDEARGAALRVTTSAPAAAGVREETARDTDRKLWLNAYAQGWRAYFRSSDSRSVFRFQGGRGYYTRPEALAAAEQSGGPNAAAARRAGRQEAAQRKEEAAQRNEPAARNLRATRALPMDEKVSVVQAFLSSMPQLPPSGSEAGLSSAQTNSIEFIFTADRTRGSVPEVSREPIRAKGGGHADTLPLMVAAQLPQVRKLIAGLPKADLVKVAAFAAVDGALEARSGGGVGTLYLIPSGVSQAYSGTFINKGRAIWLTEEKIQAVGVSSPPLAAVLCRLRDLLDQIVQSCGGGEVDVKLHLKLVHTACPHSVCSPPSSESPLPPTVCVGTDKTPTDFMLHQDAADPDRDRDVFGVKAQLTSGVAHALFSLFADRCPYMASSSFFISGPTEVVEQKSRSDTLEAEARPAMMAPPSATGSASPEGAPAGETRLAFLNRYVERLMRAEAEDFGRNLLRWEHGRDNNRSSLVSHEIVPEEGGRAIALVAVPNEQLRLPTGTTRRLNPWYYGVASLLIDVEDGAFAYTMSAEMRGAALGGVVGIGHFFGLPKEAKIGLLHAVPLQAQRRERPADATREEVQSV